MDENKRQAPRLNRFLLIIQPRSRLSIRRRMSIFGETYSDELAMLVLFLIAIFLLGIASIAEDDLRDFSLNCSTELLGAIVTFLLIDKFAVPHLKIREEKRRRRRLIRALRSSDRGDVSRARDELARGEWLYNGALSGVNLSDVNLTDLDFAKSDFAKSLLNYAKMDRTILSFARLAYAEMSDASLKVAKLIEADLDHALLQDVKLHQADLSKATLRSTVLSFAYLTEATLREANLEKADMRHAKIQRADMRGANLKFANLRQAVLVGCDLRGALLGGAKLQGADLRSAKLNGVILDDAEYGLPKVDSHTILPDGSRCENGVNDLVYYCESLPE